MSPAYFFAKKTNVIILCLVNLCVLLWDKPNWNMLGIAAYLFTFIICLTIVVWPQKNRIRYFKLIEGEFGKCYGAKEKALDDAQFVLSESKSRLSMLGCWLVFMPIANNDNTAYFKRWFGNTITIFVPKQYLSISDYKSLCRHLIWHTKA